MKQEKKYLFTEQRKSIKDALRGKIKELADLGKDKDSLGLVTTYSDEEEYPIKESIGFLKQDLLDEISFLHGMLSELCK